MNIHEYQGKEILKKYGVTVQRGIVADSPDGALAAAKELQAETGQAGFNRSSCRKDDHAELR